MKKNFQDWLHIAAHIPDTIEVDTFCPSCSCASVDYCYCGDRKTRVGYGLFWCMSCKKGIHISRLTIPETIPDGKIAYFDDPNGAEKMTRYVPEFERITP
ncbi:hypothetical protein [Candidatus Enterococcus clewellii]|uniref:Uncharacterized protein n=1 Tax=Candidatus Enterococcus clewellii TaxID=1834193 RepID=A0A242K6P5_9ENTE|nr:hypothetical protein [Enterococcus sp. 9E7_DIV0242]OTP15980.1 hypothetical protein A5888_002194 [Enterococcus sp. 9E7_DIV0242]